MLSGCLVGLVLLALAALAVIGVSMAHAADDHDEPDELYLLALPEASGTTGAKRDSGEAAAADMEVSA